MKFISKESERDFKYLTKRVKELEIKKEHIHCKICKRVIEKPYYTSTIDYALEALKEHSNQTYYDIGVCKSCVKTEGINKVTGKKLKGGKK